MPTQELIPATPAPESQQQTRLTKSEYNTFMNKFFNEFGECSVGKQDGINIAIFRLDSDRKCENLLGDINIGMYEKLTKFIENDLDKDPRMIDRSMIFESEIKAGTLSIRWV